MSTPSFVLHHPLLLAVLLVAVGPLPVKADTLPTHARTAHKDLKEKILPYWFDTALDPTNGGYRLADDGKGGHVAKEKQIVSQARMIWTFSHVHQRGFSDPRRNYLAAAQNGYRFLITRFFDQTNGGYFWKTDLTGRPINACKFLYGEAFVVYALVEYYRASGERDALDRALSLYHTIQERLHDRKHDGWFEHADADWRLLQPGDRRNEVEVIGYKSANAHLHWMEALAELYDVTRDKAVKKSLTEALRLNMKYFYPLKPGKACFHCTPNWKVVTAPGSTGLSYGHNVEFAWLMIRAQEVLRQRPSWRHFESHLDHALKYGYDHARGGLYNRGNDDQPASQTDKVWWVQAEMLAALTDALGYKPRPVYAAALEELLHFIAAHQADPADGIWFDTVTAEGKPKNPAKAHNWKANYHDVRALMKFVEAFESAPLSLPRAPASR